MTDIVELSKDAEDVYQEHQENGPTKKTQKKLRKTMNKLLKRDAARRKREEIPNQ